MGSWSKHRSIWKMQCKTIHKCARVFYWGQRETTKKWNLSRKWKYAWLTAYVNRFASITRPNRIVDFALHDTIMILAWNARNDLNDVPERRECRETTKGQRSIGETRNPESIRIEKMKTERRKSAQISIEIAMTIYWMCIDVRQKTFHTRWNHKRPRGLFSTSTSSPLTICVV